MNRPTSLIARIRRPRNFAWLALVALATLQLATAQHESAHLLGDLTESCEICLKLDAPTAAESAFASAASLPAAATDAAPLASQVSDRSPVFVRPARAPPLA